MLTAPQGPVSEHEDKARILPQHFTSLMGTNVASDLNWEELNLPSSNLSHLDSAFSLEELKSAIDSMRGEKASGPDGFIGNFYKKCWPIIKIGRAHV